MRSLFMLLCLCFLSKTALATASVSLSAQACLPYVENGSLYFNCAAEETVNIGLKNMGSGLEFGSWTKSISLGTSTLTVSLEVSKRALLDGSYITSVSGEIDQGNGVKLVLCDSNLSPDLSVSLKSLVPYGNKNGLPHFFYGMPLNFNGKANAAAMERSLLAR